MGGNFLRLSREAKSTSSGRGAGYRLVAADLEIGGSLDHHELAVGCRDSGRGIGHFFRRIGERELRRKSRA